mmetsp:Transcript_38996/g.83125  ORF Transcript_38996/g.83125 Transcript_38996/m.83125 type:complete len:240 (+) Transcript_38996:349-1068(+)
METASSFGGPMARASLRCYAHSLASGHRQRGRRSSACRPTRCSCCRSALTCRSTPPLRRPCSTQTPRQTPLGALPTKHCLRRSRGQASSNSCPPVARQAPRHSRPGYRGASSSALPQRASTSTSLSSLCSMSPPPTASLPLRAFSSACARSVAPLSSPSHMSSASPICTRMNWSSTARALTNSMACSKSRRSPMTSSPALLVPPRWTRISTGLFHYPKVYGVTLREHCMAMKHISWPTI